MNIAEILKNYPKGTKLYSPVFGEVEFVGISGDGTLIDVKHNHSKVLFYSDGKYGRDGECLLFPSRCNRDWTNFYICPFKKGDFIVKECLDGGKHIAIFSHFGGPYEYTTNYLCLLRANGIFKPYSDFGIGKVQEARLATYSEKKELLDAIARNGYYWDECSMTLKKLEKVVTKFDINKLKPFDKVLARDTDLNTWICRIYSHYHNNNKYRYICVDNSYAQCIPYNNDTKHLVGTTNDCPKCYKTWE